jgi:hypothetical protein
VVTDAVDAEAPGSSEPGQGGGSEESADLEDVSCTNDGARSEAVAAGSVCAAGTGAAAAARACGAGAVTVRTKCVGKAAATVAGTAKTAGVGPERAVSGRVRVFFQPVRPGA